jgi:hypothetical protein
MGVSKKECSTFSWERTWGGGDGTVSKRGADGVRMCVCVCVWRASGRGQRV